MNKKIFSILFIVTLVFAIYLRFSNFLVAPPSLYWEEVALGYDAYSIKETLKDHHGNSLPLVAFESFGDWKPSVYFYSIVPFLYLFDLSDLAVRLPSMLAGVFIVFGIFKLSIVLGKYYKIGLSSKQLKLFGLLSTVVATFNPWLIQFSRAAWEVNLATSFLVWATYFGFKWLGENKSKFIYLSTIFFIFCTYTYHATRIIAPLILLFILLCSYFPTFKKIFKNKSFKFKYLFKTEFIAGLLFLVLLLPLLISSKSPEVSQRFAQTSIFYNLDVVIESNRAQELSNLPFKNIIFHRYVFFVKEILKNAFSHFTLDFLFVSGDMNPRHSTGFTGIFYYTDLIFLLCGLFALIKKKSKLLIFLSFWIFVALIPASISKTVPHSLRILPSAPAFIIILSYGFLWFIENIKKYLNLYLVILFIFGIYFVQFSAFWKYYIYIYPTRWASEWQYGYKQVMKDVYELNSQTDSYIYVTRNYGRPSMYYFFYNKISPDLVQSRGVAETKDQGELTSFYNIKFVDSVSQIKQVGFVFVTPQEATQLKENYSLSKINEYKTLDGSVIWESYEITK